jgi:hypothetical protein
MPRSLCLALVASSLFASAVLAGPSSVLAQQPDGNTMGNQPQQKQSAPAENSHASGHDVQSGQPQTGEIDKTAPHANRGGSETTGGPATIGGEPAHESNTPRR